jgi:hypothetical protein
MPAMPGPSQQVTVGDKVYLNGAESHSESYAWACLSYPRGSHCLMRDDGTATPSFVADEEGEYVFLLQTDGDRRAQTSVKAYAHADDPGPALGEGLSQEIEQQQHEQQQEAQAQVVEAQQRQAARAGHAQASPAAPPDFRLPHERTGRQGATSATPAEDTKK